MGESSSRAAGTCGATAEDAEIGGESGHPNAKPPATDCSVAGGLLAPRGKVGA